MGHLADMGKTSRNPELTRLCARDPKGGGTPVPLGFLASLLRYRHQVPHSRPSTAAKQCDPQQEATLTTHGHAETADAQKGVAPSEMGECVSAQSRRGLRVLRVHPAQDTWTPPRLSLDSLSRSGLAWEYTPLPKSGHFPIEEPGLTRMVVAITRFSAPRIAR